MGASGTTKVNQRVGLKSIRTRILSLQDEERRGITRGLHDSLGQYLTALKMNLDLLSSTEGRQAAVASECSEIVDKCQMKHALSSISFTHHCWTKLV